MSKADVIIELAPGGICFPEAVVCVRPESNEVRYERSIILGSMPFADIVYLANINGEYFSENHIIETHYPVQYHFSLCGKQAMRCYPEMMNDFSAYFNTDFETAEIIGSYEAIQKKIITAEQLFNYIVVDEFFLRSYGQTIKKIDDYFVINYDIPALISMYNKTANVFVVVLRFKNCNYTFSEINQSIYDEIININMPIIGNDRKLVLSWNELIKRTYHISRNHIMAMFDMLDYVFRKDSSVIHFSETPLGSLLINNYGFSEDAIRKIKEFPLVRICQNSDSRLVYLSEYAKDKSLEESAEIIKSIVK